MIFGAADQFFLEAQKTRLFLSELGPAAMDLRIFLVKTHHVLRTGYMGEQSNYGSGETDNCSRKLSEGNLRGGILRSLPVFFAVPPRKSRVFGEKEKHFLEPLKKIP